MEQFEGWVMNTSSCRNYQLDDNTAEKLDDQPMILSVVLYISISIYFQLALKEVSNLSSHQKAHDIYMKEGALFF